VPEYPRKFSKCEQMGAKFVRTTSTIEKRDERKLLPQHFTHVLWMCTRIKNISLSRYRVPRKTFKFVPVVPTAHGIGPKFVRTESLFKAVQFSKMFWGLFIGDDM